LARLITAHRVVVPTRYGADLIPQDATGDQLLLTEMLVPPSGTIPISDRRQARLHNRLFVGTTFAIHTMRRCGSSPALSPQNLVRAGVGELCRSGIGSVND
jgi:hypothetical protein